MAKQKYHEEEAKKDVSANWYQTAMGLKLLFQVQNVDRVIKLHDFVEEA